MDMGPTVAEVREKLQHADAAEFAVLERSLVADTRKGVRNAVEAARRRIAAEQEEAARLQGMYDFQADLAGGRLVVGLDEVGRGPLAGPLAVGAVVLPETPLIAGLNDSKQIKHNRRALIADEVRKLAIAWTVRYIEPGDIDAEGMAASLRKAFSGALADIEAQGVHPDVVLLDGNPLHIDEREVNVVKGDGKCASVAAASIVAKEARDALMVEYDARYPGYGFAENKGYASAAHIQAIEQRGLCPIHRASFCHAFTQESLF